MDSQFLKSFLELLIFLPFILILIYLLGKAVNKTNISPPGRYIKILERLSISKESSILVIKIGDKAYIMANNSGKTEILKELEQEEILKIEQMKKENMNYIKCDKLSHLFKKFKR